MKPRAVVSWSSGKDSAYALHLAAEQADAVGMLTTLTADYERISIHGVRESILEAQASAAGLPLRKVLVAKGCSLADYEGKLGEALAQLRADDITHVIFGDIFLADIRAYREAQLACGLTGIFPLWGRATGVLAREMIAAGMAATIACVDPRVLDRSFAGRRWDAVLLDELPAGIDPCAENGEFHTCVTHGPMFRTPLALQLGDVVEREGFVFADLHHQPCS
jgi:uncharacterized protein (TIGR00290 family)